MNDTLCALLAFATAAALAGICTAADMGLRRFHVWLVHPRPVEPEVEPDPIDADWP